MRLQAFRLTGAAVVLALICTGCAAQMGEAAGNTVGGTVWVGMKTTKLAVKGGKLAFKGGKFAVTTTGRTFKGAANGVHEEFSPKPDDVTQAKGASAEAAQANGAKDRIALSQSESTTLPY